MRKYIWKLMKDKGLKQKNLAKFIKMHPTRISQLANSLSEPTKVEVEKLVDYFEKPESELFNKAKSIEVKFPMTVTTEVVDKLIEKREDKPWLHGMYI